MNESQHRVAYRRQDKGQRWQAKSKEELGSGGFASKCIVYEIVHEKNSEKN